MKKRTVKECGAVENTVRLIPAGRDPSRLRATHARSAAAVLYTTRAGETPRRCLREAFAGNRSARGVRALAQRSTVGRA